MFAILAIALSLAQSTVVARAESSPDAVMNAEIVQRPSGMTTSAFIERLIDDSDARQWKRSEDRVPLGTGEMRIVGLKRSADDGIILFLPGAEDATGNACLIRRQRPGDPEPQRERLLRYCIEALAQQLNAGA
jgi:hypothetical protein